jgi:hypothetical protein
MLLIVGMDGPSDILGMLGILGIGTAPSVKNAIIPYMLYMIITPIMIKGA